MPFPINAFTLMAAALIGSLSAYLAHRRGRNPYGWFFIGFLFGLFGVMAIFFAPIKRRKLAPFEPKPQPLPTIQGPSNKFWYYLDSAHQQQGPMSLDALTAALRQGKISSATYVWHEELQDWKPLQEMLKTS